MIIMKEMINRGLLYCIFAIVIGGCTCNKEKKASSVSSSPQEVKEDTLSTSTMEKDRVSHVLHSLSSPLELIILIKEEGANYQPKLLHSTGQLSDYDSGFKKALNLGIYGTDLGYVGLFEERQAAISYLDAVQNLVSDLDVKHFFDFETLKRLAANRGNPDSLLYITTASFERMNNYLRTQGRSEVGALIMAGGWVEGLYLAAQKATQLESPMLKKRVGEEKLTLNEVLVLISNYKHNPSYAQLYKKLKNLQAAYQEVRISYKPGKRRTVKKDGTVKVHGKRKSVVHITSDQLQRIKQSIADIRNYITE